MTLLHRLIGKIPLNPTASTPPKDYTPAFAITLMLCLVWGGGLFSRSTPVTDNATMLLPGPGDILTPPTPSPNPDPPTEALVAQPHAEAPAYQPKPQVTAKANALSFGRPCSDSSVGPPQSKPTTSKPCSAGKPSGDVICKSPAELAQAVNALNTKPRVKIKRRIFAYNVRPTADGLCMLSMTDIPLSVTALGQSSADDQLDDDTPPEDATPDDATPQLIPADSGSPSSRKPLMENPSEPSGTSPTPEVRGDRFNEAGPDGDLLATHFSENFLPAQVPKLMPLPHPLDWSPDGGAFAVPLSAAVSSVQGRPATDAGQIVALERSSDKPHRFRHIGPW